METFFGNRFVKTITAILLALILLANTSFPVFAFTDVEQHWAKHDITLLTAKGLTGGYSDGSFRPERGLTRAELARLLISALNMDESAWALEASSQLFRDVPSNHWARVYVQLAWEMGLVAGYKDGTFRPDQVVNRAEMAAILLRALGYNHGKGDVTFADELPSWAEESILQTAQLGLISGYEDGTFRPLEPVTRSQAVVFINRLLAVRGAQYEMYGQVVQLGGGTVTVELNGDQVKLPLSPEATVVYESQFISPSEASRHLPLMGYLAIDHNGQIAFVQLVKETKNNGITVAAGSRQEATGAGSQPAVYQVMDYRLEEDAVGPREITDPAASLAITKEAMGIPQLVSNTKADGRGQIIAIIDSGVDPGHPDLLQTVTNQRKIVGWSNFTNDGKVILDGLISAAGSALSHQGLTYRLPTLNSKSGTLRFGFLEESSQGVDFNLNGSLTDRFLVVAVDTETPGVYDQVVIDTQGDRDLTNERPLRVFEEGRQHFSFKGPYDNSFNLVVCAIDPAGDEVLFGYDQLGHGTQVAGVAAANGAIQGVAPGARLLVAKVLDREGMTDWQRLADAIRWAAAGGADVINLSLGYYQDGSAGNNTLTKLVDDLSAEGIIFTIAAGNQGPGIGTLATPGNARSAISVGAYITPEMWQNDYGYTVAAPTLWYFSSAGPRQDGLMVPTVVAPGSAVSTWPMTVGNGYRLGEGTSIAAAHVAGAVALMLESAAQRGMDFSADRLKKVLADSSRELPEMNAAEVGYGAFDADRTWRLLWRGEQVTYPLRGYAYNRRLGFGEGLFSREIMPGDVPYYVINQGQEEQLLFWNASAGWLKPLFKITSLPAGGRRELPVEYVLPEQPGIYTGWLEGKLLTSPYPDIRLMTTVIKPYLLYEDNGYRQELSGRLPAGQYKRYFFKVPPNAGALQLALRVPNAPGGSFNGRVRFHVNRPDGSPYGISDWTGLAGEGKKGQEWSNLMIEKPEPGIWEVIVYSSAA
ncbi:MAG: S8 family serine peptidase, partial [Clostridia bacterium]|nr:S8 family serine peptidase [Clostridia bacterium]